MGKKGGNCFEIAIHKARETGGLVCHGLPIGTGPVNNGLRYWHAWVEQDQAIQWGSYQITLTDVYDFSNGNKIVLPREYYYAVGRIESVFRYTNEEAAILMLQQNTYGPWVEGWETMTERGL